MSKYEISIWEDVFEDNQLVEKRIAVIGSDTMTSLNRARNPKLVSNSNGTNTFTFTMYDNYIDTLTGAYVKNPYISYLVNERKIKVLWKNKWYDLLIKNINETTKENTYDYTCEDMYLTELSRTGFNLEFDLALQNNIGTAQELVEQVIQNTDWTLDTNRSDTIYQLLEEPVYEVTIQKAIEGCVPVPKTDDAQGAFAKNDTVLLFYSEVQNKRTLKYKNEVQVCYAENYVVDDNLVVTNGKNYIIAIDKWEFDELSNKGFAYVETGKNTLNEPIYDILFEVNFNEGVSKKYRANNYINSQQSEYCNLLNRYVNVFKRVENEETKYYYGYETSQFDEAAIVANVVTNPSNFTSQDGKISGWQCSENKKALEWLLYPLFSSDTNVMEYNPKSYLKIAAKTTYFNSGIQNNRNYIKDGFTKGEIYMFRFKLHSSIGGYPQDDIWYEKRQVGDFTNYNSRPIQIGVYGRDINYGIKLDEQYFKIKQFFTRDTKALTYSFECIKSCSYENLISSDHPFGIFIRNNTDNDYWLEELQFFKFYTVKVAEGGAIVEKFLTPDSVLSQSENYWKYFDKDTTATTADEIEYYFGDDFIPLYNDYIKYGSITEKQSNRFNILQSIAENFECWILFDIKHDEQGYILRNENGDYEKYIIIKKDLGQETGLSFVYGLDLNSIERNTVSDSIATKTIVLSNNNQFGKNGFCTIARSEQNYIKENFILNFDYFIQQQLLSREMLNKDLYGYIDNDKYYPGYYDILHNTNTTYANNATTINQIKLNIVKVNSEMIICNQYIEAAYEEKSKILTGMAALTNITNYTDENDLIKQIDQYIKQNMTYTELINQRRTYSLICNNINSYEGKRSSLSQGLEELQSTLADLDTAQTQLISTLLDANTKFNKKYSRYIQEGTWNSDDYYNDDLYYLDSLRVAYTSSKPQITYNISVIRLSELEDFSSKIFNLGDICYIQDTRYFGYASDGITPYKERVLISEITSYFDSPEKDTLKIQNYTTQFDDLFQRITAATQSLQFAQGKYTNVANILDNNGSIKTEVIQNSLNGDSLSYATQNKNLVINNEGITVTNPNEAGEKIRITSGGVYLTSDGGDSWSGVIQSKGISANSIANGIINTENVAIYNSGVPGFRWDSQGISAYDYNAATGLTDSNHYVRFDQYGIYGINKTQDINFVPNSIKDIEENASFGLTWDKFFLHSQNEHGSIEISTDNDIIVRTLNEDNENIDRVTIGRLDNFIDIEKQERDYGIVIRDSDGEEIFRCDSEHAGMVGGTVGGWFIKSTDDDGAELYSTTERNNKGKPIVNRLSSVGIKDNRDDLYYIITPAAQIGGIKIIDNKINDHPIEDFLASGGNIVALTNTEIENLLTI